MAAFSRHEPALAWGKTQAIAQWGPIALESPLFEHNETKFYEPTMGAGLRKTFWAFERLIDPGLLVDLKYQSNAWEEEYASQSQHAEQRPLNLDPGYLTEAKLVLATTKDREHRLYLSRGIYAESTLWFHHGAWEPRAWTYPDYRREDYHHFFTQCREYLRGCYRRR
jgi:hypothetical protein